MEFRLKKLSMENFKGMKKFELFPEGNDINVKGANRSGKTSVADAYNWLLFNKDSVGNTKFDIKPLDENGDVQHGLETVVEAEFDLDGKVITLKKVYMENWTKKRGSSKETLSGHKTSYEINDIPKNKTDFDNYIKELIQDINIFRLVSDPMYFNSLSNDKKRDILMNVVGEISDADVISSNDEVLTGLEKDLENYTFEELKARNKRDKKAANEKLKSNPVRIDEISRGLKEDVRSLSDVEKEIKEAETEVESKKQQINDIRNGSEIIDKKNKLKDIAYELRSTAKSELTTAQHDLDSYVLNFDEGTSNDLRKLKYKHDADQADLSIKKSELQRESDQLKRQIEYRDDLRQDFANEDKILQETKAEQKVFEVTEVCECCGQNLPEEKIEQHREEQQEKYNEQRAERIKILEESKEFIRSKGKDVAETIQKTETVVGKITSEVERINNIVVQNEEKIAELETGVIKPEETEQYKELKASFEDLKKLSESLQTDEGLSAADDTYKALYEEISNYSASVSDSTGILEKEVSELKVQLRDLNNERSEIVSQERDIARIEELKEESASIAKQFEELEAYEDMLNAFITSKVNLVESRISGNFKNVKFKLFEDNLNGGVEEKCVTTWNGVPYDTGLNTEGRVNAGLDIINTLSKHYDLIVPIIIDNCESVSSPIETSGQQLRFTVAKNKNLKMEEV